MKKKTTKLLITIACIFVIVGAMLIGAGFASGGSVSSLHIGKDNTSWWPFSVNVGLFSDGNVGVIMSTPHEPTEDGQKTHWEKELSSNTKVKIHVDMGDIVVKKGTKAAVTFLNIKESYVSMYEEDGRQVIEVDYPDYELNIKSGTVEVTLPENRYDLEIENNLGDINVAELSFHHLDIENDLGDIQLINIISEDTEADEKSGDVTLTGSFTGKTSVENKLGDIQIELSGKREDYSLEVSNDLGDTSIDSDLHELRCNIKQNNGMKDSLEVDDKLGDITITFR